MAVVVVEAVRGLNQCVNRSRGSVQTAKRVTQCFAPAVARVVQWHLRQINKRRSAATAKTIRGMLTRSGVHALTAHLSFLLRGRRCYGEMRHCCCEFILPKRSVNTVCQCSASCSLKPIDPNRSRCPQRRAALCQCPHYVPPDTLRNKLSPRNETT